MIYLILALEFDTRSCLKPQNPCSNLNMAFTCKSLNWSLICMHDVTLECVAAVFDHFADAFVRENVARVYMTLWRRNNVRKLTLTPFCLRNQVCEKGYLMFKRRFQRCLCRNQVKYARITITHVCFIALTLAGPSDDV